MKKTLAISATAIAAMSGSFGRMKIDKPLEAKLFALEKKAREALENYEGGDLRLPISEEATGVDDICEKL